MSLFGRRERDDLRSELANSRAQLRVCEQDARRLRAVLDAVPVGLVLSDLDGKPVRYARLSEGSGRNILFSPVSLSMGLALLRAGAEGGLDERLRQAGHFPEDERLAREL